MRPSNRTLQKFGRDAGLAAVAALLIYAGDHLADLGLAPSVAPFAATLVTLAYRWVRGAQGREPTAG
jgi:hypothetical protein